MHEGKPELKVTGDMRPIDPKKAEKERKREEQYWNKVISRREAFEMSQRMIQQAVAAEQDKLRIMFIQTQTLLQVIMDKFDMTKEELDELSKPFVEKVYGKQDTKETEK